MLGLVIDSVGRLETVLVGVKSDLGLVGRVEGLAKRLHHLETISTALAVHAGITFPKQEPY